MLCPALLALLALPWTPPDPNDLHCELQRYDAASYTPTSLAELKPSIFDQYPVGTPSVHGRYAPSPAAGTRLVSLGEGS